MAKISYQLTRQGGHSPRRSLLWRPRVPDVLNMAGTDQHLLDAGKGAVVRRLRLRDRFAARALHDLDVPAPA